MVTDKIFQTIYRHLKTIRESPRKFCNYLNQYEPLTHTYDPKNPFLGEKFLETVEDQAKRWNFL